MPRRKVWKGKIYDSPLVDKTGECWLWIGVLCRGGYPMMRRNGVARTASRWAYIDFYGIDPVGKVVCHSCDVRNCVNPAHLFIGTQGDNLRDMNIKKRGIHTRKTHCKNGHEFNTLNTQYKNNQRVCRVCHRANWHRNSHKWPSIKNKK